MLAIGLHTPKSAINVGHVLRAAHAFGACMVAMTGRRIDHTCNVSNAQHYLPLLRGDDLHSMIPYGFVPVAIEFDDRATALPEYKHPGHAFYVFGPEDSGLGAKTISWCRDLVYVPTKICLNLAACVNVVLYDRLAKEHVAKPHGI